MRDSILKKAVGMLTNNIGLKFLAVIVSCGLWFMVNAITDPMDKKIFNNIPVEIINEDMITSEGKVYEILDNTNSVNVSVTGKSSVLSDITRDDIRAVADMSKLTFMNTVGIEISSARNNSDLDFSKNIDSMKLSIENRKSLQKNIIALTTGEPSNGYIAERADASPNVVRFSGPESIIAQIDRVEAVANVDGCSSNISTNVELKIYDADNNEIRNNSIKMNISTVNVSVSILGTKAVPLSFALQGEPAAGYVVKEPVLGVPETVLLAGRNNVLEGITKWTISDPILSVEGLTETKTEIVNIKKYLPSGAQFADANFSGNVSVTMSIERLVARTFDIPARNFAAGSKPEGFNVTLAEVDNNAPYKIGVSGTKAAVDAMRAEGIIGVVDMEQLREKLGIDEWTAGAYEGEITFNLPENVKLAQPYKLTLVLEKIEN